MRTALPITFWAAAVLLLYTYAGYPLWIYLRSRVRPRPWREAPFFPTVSVILVAHNGAAALQQKLDQLLTLDYPPDRLELIAVSDGSTDGTSRILQPTAWCGPLFFRTASANAPRSTPRCAAPQEKFCCSRTSAPRMIPPRYII